MKTASLLKYLREQGVEVSLAGDNLDVFFRDEHVPETVIDQVRAHKQELLSYLRAIADNDHTTAIPKAAEQEVYPASSSQTRFWVLCQMEAVNIAYNLPVTLRLKGTLDTAALRQAIDRLITRHEILRTHFVQAGDLIGQRILEPADFSYEIITRDSAGDKETSETLSAFVRTPFVLEAAALFKVLLIRQQETDHILCINIHHIIADGGSLEILLQELMFFYNSIVEGTGVALSPLKIQFKDYVAWSADKEQIKREETYWLQQLAGDIPVINLPALKGRPALKTYNGAYYSVTYDQDMLKEVRAFSNRNKGTTFMTLMAALNGLLYRYTSQTDIILGTPISGRNHPDLQGQIGLFINTLPIRMQFDPQQSFTDLFELQKAALEGAYAHAGYAFGDLVGQLNLNRDLSRSPLFDVLVTHQRKIAGVNSDGSGFAGLTSSFYSNFSSTVSKYDLTFTFFEDDTDLALSIEYNTDIFDYAFVRDLAGNLEGFIRQAVKAPEQQISAVPFLEEWQVQQLQRTFNDTRVPYDTAATVIELFAAQAKLTPDRTAVVCEDIAITYRQLDEQSTRLALYLRSLGVGPGAITGVCMGRSVKMLQGILAILKTGAAYLPIDPFYPLDRIDYIAAHSGAEFILTDSGTQDIMSARFTAINLEDDEHWDVKPLNVLPAADSQALAYVIYTSGSTGKPKGVKVSHNNLTNFILGMDQHFAKKAASGDVWLAMTSISFDISILELLWTITRGDKVVLHLERPVPVQAQAEVDFSLFYFPTGTQSVSNKYRLLLEGAKFADQHGFKAIWVPERHFHDFGDQFPNPSVAAAAVATITKHIRIRSGSVVLPLHDTVRVAEEWSMVDNLSGGRVELSIASGWHPNDFVLAPAVYNDRYQAMRSKITELKQLWSGASMSRTNGIGKAFSFTIHPKPIQQEVPLWITAGGSVDTFRYAGTIGANILTHLLGQSIDDLAGKIKVYRETLQSHGFDPQQGKVALMVHTFVSDNATEVREIVERPFKNYLKNSLNLLKPIAEEQHLDLEQDEETLLEMGFRRYYNTSSLFGTPESCLSVINEIYAAGVNEIGCLIDFGVDEDLVLGSLPHLFTLKELVRRAKLQHRFIVERLQQLKGDQQTAYLIDKYQVTHMQATPSFYEELLQEEQGREALKQIDTLLVGGEALKQTLASKLTALRNKPVYNMYGPTETTIWSSVQTIVPGAAVNIGKPIANTTIYVLDQFRQLCPVGVAGELCIGGDGVTQGYLHNEQLTAGAFIPDPFMAGQRLYKTGDLARWLPGGELECLGRLDRQVKINGYRIELEEIETVLLAYTDVLQAVVAAKEVGTQRVLVAYLKVATEVDESAVRAFLRLRLPAYMIPTHIMVLDSFPYTPNGKVDHQQLPSPEGRQIAIRKVVPPANETEEKLAAIWTDFLQLDTLSVEDNFFEIGGNSMKAFQLLSVINTAMDTDLEIIAFFQYPTVRMLAASLSEKQHNRKEVLVKENEMEDVDDLIDFMNNV
ncbi:MupA/Atu3671 family FMN-dependent luciferase-like monooxygenase [Chitinophaga rhizophila]|uniref:LLM class flavin-dependent oxidoreductase n=1 Tax=Chitinophaga rhizophila TaxID=2866212 RepID=A0ABS7GIN6_9BACT|nr:MupA/Atu3671 family FMN-dependent luciferase-like monooxygenase [Chitinophaga rhizophila]MBW8687181.1 LLM class flavin-dependent oxidoreductase [Chitinophaga rhizophila]